MVVMLDVRYCSSDQRRGPRPPSPPIRHHSIAPRSHRRLIRTLSLLRWSSSLDSLMTTLRITSKYYLINSIASFIVSQELIPPNFWLLMIDTGTVHEVVEPFIPPLRLNMLFHMLHDNHCYTRDRHCNGSTNDVEVRRKRKGEETRQPLFCCIPLFYSVRVVHQGDDDDDTNVIVAACNDGKTCGE